MIESDPHSATSMVGRTIAGRYTIRATIGSGGMGFVYRATQSPIEREVALKVLRVDLAHQEGIAERFTREARAASRIQHPNAITIFEFGEDDGIFYLAMELLYGETLRQRMRREPPLTPENALDIFEAMAGALAAAHRVGVVHRDLKPDNIFLAQFDGIGEVVKVLDFGLAKLLDRAADAEGLVTDVNLRLGTPRYMAPEQALGLQPIDARCDVYALGLLLFEMLAHRAPYVGEDGMEVLAQRLRREAPRLSQVAPDMGFSEHLDDLLANMLLHDREHRPADANEVVTRLRELRRSGLAFLRPDRTDQNPVVQVVGEPYRPSPTPARVRGTSAQAPPPAPPTPVISGPMFTSGPHKPIGPQSGRGQPLQNDAMGLDDFDKPTVVITSGRAEMMTPANLSATDSGMHTTATPSAGHGQPSPPPQRRDDLVREQTTTSGRAQRHSNLHLSPRFILVVLLIAAGAPILALLIRWYQGRTYRPDPPGHEESATPQVPSPPLGVKPTVTPMVDKRPKTPPGPGEAPVKPPGEGHVDRPRVCRIRLVTTPPGAHVMRDGTDLGTTPLVDSMPYSSTPLAYSISAAGYVTYETAVTPEHRRTLNISLKPTPALPSRPPQRPPTPAHAPPPVSPLKGFPPQK